MGARTPILTVLEPAAWLSAPQPASARLAAVSSTAWRMARLLYTLTLGLSLFHFVFHSHMKLLIEGRPKTRIPFGMMAQLCSARPLSGHVGEKAGVPCSDKQCSFRSAFGYPAWRAARAS
jgi:hypothetical protein